MADPSKARGGMGGHQSHGRGKAVWLTPPHIIDALGPFDLDPCAAPLPRPWPTAGHMVTLPNDGLKLSWHGRIWLNPPYDADAWLWLDRLAEHGCGLALIFARTETFGFHRSVWERAQAVRFLEGRLHFHHPDGRRAAFNGGAPSVLVAYGDYDADRLCRSSIAGAFIRLRP